ncbi:hypothetical protein AAFF_G00159560 [Aldrovandia affinis]|uniref:Uncharacterized protein n=1 Tax=Aldrovandia affinis TaxID=143900 RepID=A0AAD7R0F0_9TELE|nr:hypothetical protein AAFF_G00159560 [Aldrovandia affinis]
MSKETPNHVKHIERMETSDLEPQQKSLHSNQWNISQQCSRLSAGEATGGLGRNCMLAIVPVRVKVTKRNKSVLTYAFLDPGSSATFCTENLMKRLHAKGWKTEILLRTMGQERPVQTMDSQDWK